jgi:hypothetical protein
LTTEEITVRLLTSSDSTTSFTAAAGVAAANAKLRSKPKNHRRILASVFTLVLAGALSGCAAYHEQEKCGDDGCPGDAKITAEVKQALARHPDLGGTDTVYVQTVNHVVYLTGIVDSGLQREAAESVAHKASGVTAVVDNISISK